MSSAFVGLCFIKNPAEHPTFAKYFTKIWQDTYLLSLQNFLAVIVCYMRILFAYSYDLLESIIIMMLLSPIYLKCTRMDL